MSIHSASRIMPRDGASGLKSGKNKDVTIKAFPRLNHLFQSSQTDLPAEYMTIEETMSPQVLETVSA